MIVDVISESPFFPKGHGVHTAFLNQVNMLREAGVHVLVNSFKKSDITHIHTVGLPSYFFLKTRRPVVVTAHVIPASFVGSLIGAQYWLGWATAYLRHFYNSADIVIAVAPKVKEELIKIGVTTRIEVFPNPISHEWFKKDEKHRIEGRKMLGIHQDAFVALGAGQVQTRKGIGDFLEVANMLPDVTFIWAGGQPFKELTEKDPKLTKLLANLPKNVLFPGNFPYKKMPALYNAADIFFFPSYQENAPMAPLEAAACHLPLLLRDIEEYKLLYKTGYLMAQTNDEFKAMIQKLQTNHAFYKKSAEESYQLSLAFGFKKRAEQLLGYYNSLIKS